MTKFSRTQTPHKTPRPWFTFLPPRVFQDRACSSLSAACHSTAFLPCQSRPDPSADPPAHPPLSLQKVTPCGPGLCPPPVKKVHPLLLREYRLHSAPGEHGFAPKSPSPSVLTRHPSHGHHSGCYFPTSSILTRPSWHSARVVGQGNRLPP